MGSTDSSTGSLHPHLPPGFRFHRTDEELVVHYLQKKAAAEPFPIPIIAEVDLYKFDSWELPEKAVFGEKEWYFFSPRDKKYPNGARPNRATPSGYWKATGTDKPVLTGGGPQKVGVKKALVFYLGKPPKGIKTNWIMHEYRLQDTNKPTSKPPRPGCNFGCEKGSLRLDDWVLCRIYKKNNYSQRPVDQRDDIKETIDSIPPLIARSVGQQHKLQGNDDQNLCGRMMITLDTMNSDRLGLSGSRATSQLPMVSNNHMDSAERSLPNLYWDSEAGNENSTSTKTFSSKNCGGRTGETTTNPMATIPGQIPQTPSPGQQTLLSNFGERVFGQQPYQVPGMNWYS